MRFLICAAGVVLLTAANPAWEAYKPQDGAYSVSFPGKPMEETAKVPFRIHKLQVVLDSTRFTLIQMDGMLSEKDLKEPDGKDKFLDGFIKGQTGTGKVLKREVVTLDKHPGRAFVIQHDEYAMRTTVYLVNNRAYALAVAGKEATGTADKFFQSFKLLK